MATALCSPGPFDQHRGTEGRKLHPLLDRGRDLGRDESGTRMET